MKHQQTGKRWQESLQLQKDSSQCHRSAGDLGRAQGGLHFPGRGNICPTAAAPCSAPWAGPGVRPVRPSGGKRTAHHALRPRPIPEGRRGGATNSGGAARSPLPLVPRARARSSQVPRGLTECRRLRRAQRPRSRGRRVARQGEGRRWRESQRQRETRGSRKLACAPPTRERGGGAAARVAVPGGAAKDGKSVREDGQPRLDRVPPSPKPTFATGGLAAKEAAALRRRKDHVPDRPTSRGSSARRSVAAAARDALRGGVGKGGSGDRERNANRPLSTRFLRAAAWLQGVVLSGGQSPHLAPLPSLPRPGSSRAPGLPRAFIRNPGTGVISFLCRRRNRLRAPVAPAFPEPGQGAARGHRGRGGGGCGGTTAGQPWPPAPLRPAFASRCCRRRLRFLYGYVKVA